MELAITVLIWVAAVGLTIFSLLGGVHISALTDRVQANAESIREDTKQRREGLR